MYPCWSPNFRLMNNIHQTFVQYGQSRWAPNLFDFPIIQPHFLIIPPHLPIVPQQFQTQSPHFSF